MTNYFPSYFPIPFLQTRRSKPLVGLLLFPCNVFRKIPVITFTVYTPPCHTHSIKAHLTHSFISTDVMHVQFEQFLSRTVALWNGPPKVVSATNKILNFSNLDLTVIFHTYADEMCRLLCTTLQRVAPKPYLNKINKYGNCYR